MNNIHFEKQHGCPSGQRSGSACQLKHLFALYWIFCKFAFQLLFHAFDEPVPVVTATEGSDVAAAEYDADAPDAVAQHIAHNTVEIIMHEQHRIIGRNIHCNTRMTKANMYGVYGQ